MLVRMCDSCGKDTNSENDHYEIRFPVFENGSNEGKPAYPKLDLCGICSYHIRLAIVKEMDRLKDEQAKKDSQK